MFGHPRILKDLQMCLEEAKQEFELLLVHSGVQFLSKAVLEKVVDEKAIFRVEPPASILLQRQEYAILLSNGLFDPIRARIAHFDLCSGVLELVDFGFALTKFGERREIRVEPNQPYQVDIVRHQQTLTGQMIDISLSGIGVQVASMEPLQNLSPGETIQVICHLPESVITLPGAIYSITQKKKDIRLSIGFTENVLQKAVILRYIMGRRAEIRQELEEQYEVACVHIK